ncbi:MAG: hypothetical protein NT125_08625 [Candidatus Bipolaricaulota bacterium]|nr:hypothetical protein [Candidatus Bipolaricaulota bacterium]
MTMIAPEKYPRTIQRSRLDSVIEEEAARLPAGTYPDLSIVYQDTGKLIRVLAVGPTNHCAREMTRLLREHPEYAKGQLRTRRLRTPATSSYYY